MKIPNMSMDRSIILLHGALGCRADYDKVLDQLANHQVHTFDFRGHGTAVSKGSFTISDLADELEEQLGSWNVSNAHIFGFSMGGYVALTLAARGDKRIGSIGTLGTKLRWTSAFAEGQLKYLDPEAIQVKVPKFASHLEMLHGPRWKEVLDHTGKMMQNLAANETLTSSDFAQIEAPVTILRGSLDHMVDREESEEVAQWLSKGVYIELEDIHHPIERMDPEVLGELIINTMA